MTPQLYWKPLKKVFPFLIAASLIVGLVAIGVVRQQGSKSRLDFSYMVVGQREAATSSPVYRFDDYYALQATELFSKSLAAWLSAPATIAAALGREDRHDLVVTAPAAGLIHLTLSSANPAVLPYLRQVVDQLARQYLDRYNASNPSIVFRIEAAPEWVRTPEPPWRLVGVVSFLLTFFIGLNAALVWITLHENRH